MSKLVTGQISMLKCQTNNLCGLDGPIPYLVNTNDNGNGRYSIGLKTEGFHFGNYTNYFKKVKYIFIILVTETIYPILQLYSVIQMTINYLSGGSIYQNRKVSLRPPIFLIK
jgi:hypothetical protein